MKTARHETERSCGHRDSLAAYLAGELAPAEQTALERHMAQCESCRRDAVALRGVLHRLKDVPERTVSRDLAPEIMARLDRPAPVFFTPWPWWVRTAAAAAAVLFLLAGIRWLIPGRAGSDLAQKNPPAALPAGKAPPAPDATPAAAAQEWLCRTQEPDGSWDTARWGGHKNFEVALAGLSLMALLDAEQGDAVSGREEAARRAAGYLISRQAADGALGPSFDGAPYNQGIGALALLRAHQRLGGTTLKDAADRALRMILARQNRDGGWGYMNEAVPRSNLSITLWQAQSLGLAISLGWTNTVRNLEQGLRWIAGVSDDHGAFGYNQAGDFPSGSQTLTAMGAMTLFDEAHGNLLAPGRRRAMAARIEEMAARPEPGMDYYRHYFLTAALRKMNQTQSRERLATLQSDLATRQISEGENSGSWDPDDQWSSTGGRVYATSLASLSFRAQGP